MNLHPDVLTDLVILYHAGEASQASRELLEKEAQQNPAIAAALATQPRVMQPMRLDPMLHEVEVLRRVRQHYLYRALMVIGVILALFILFTMVRSSSRPVDSPDGTGGGVERQEGKRSPK